MGSSFKEPVYFKLSAFGQDFHLNVTLNHHLFSSNFEIEVRGNASSEFLYEIDHCHYIGQLLPTKEKGNKVALSNCDGLVRNFGFTVCLRPEGRVGERRRRETEARDEGIFMFSTFILLTYKGVTNIKNNQSVQILRRSNKQIGCLNKTKIKLPFFSLDQRR